MIELTIKKNDSGQRVDRFLMKVYPKLGIGFVCKMIRKKRIKLNNKRCEPNEKLNENDTLQLYINDELLEGKETDADDFSAAPNELNIVYEDGNILLVDKPQGLVVHEDNSNTSDTLINRIKRYLCDKGEYVPCDEQTFAPALCNRIDRNTSGIVIAAKNAESLRILSQKIHDRELVKLYLCIVCGVPEPKEATLTAYLEKKSDENSVIVTDRKTPSNLTIKTKYRVLDEFEDKSLSLAEVDLLTGRTHQIRAHFAHIGHPLLGDGKYGSNTVNKKYGVKYQALCSYKLTFRFTTDAGILGYLNNREFQVSDTQLVSDYYKKKEEQKK